MSTVGDTLYQEALKLTEQERAELAAKLMDSIDEGRDADWAEAWDAEIAKRLEELESGKIETIPWDEVRRGLIGPRQ